MANPSPLQSFLGGVGLTIPVHSLLILNGAIFGISGFLHGAVRGRTEALASVAGLLIGGATVGVVEGFGPEIVEAALPSTILAGLLVGIGTKLSNGCTSGHMICGLSRFSTRSIAATTTFFLTAVVTAQVSHRDTLPPIQSTDWSLGLHGKILVTLQILPSALSALLYIMAPTPLRADKGSPQQEPSKYLRLATDLITGFNFAIALRISNLSDPNRVISFLLPFDRAFDPSLAYLAAGALPISMLLYHFARGNERPRLGGKWEPKVREIDLRLLLGATIFGAGWGLGGICPGPGLINLGRALSSGSGIKQSAIWVGSVALGGLLVG